MERTTPGKVPFWLNLLLTLAFFAHTMALFLFHRRDITKRDALISTLPYLKDHRLIQLTVGITAMAVAVVLFVWILREVWNRVITKLLPVPEIAFSEAYALTILFFTITIWISP